MNKQQYIVVYSGDADTLQLAVNNMIAVGYTPQGGVSVGHNYLYQAMVLKAD